MGKVKKSKKDRKKQKKKIENMKLSQLISFGKNFLSQGNSRSAIEYLKLASKKHGLTEEIKHLLFKAYQCRAEELNQKGLTKEADILSNHALVYIPSMNTITEGDMAVYISTLNDKKSIEAYAGYLKHNEHSPDLEQKISYHLLLKQNFSYLNFLDESNPLRKNVDVIENSISYMNIGKWEDALDLMKSIPRSSPYASMKIFCQAMVLFYKEDDAKLTKILSKIPDDFPLSSIAHGLTVYCNPDSIKDDKNKAIKDIKCLFELPENYNQLINNIFTLTKQYKFKTIKKLLKDYAGFLFPDNPQETLYYIIGLLLSEFITDANAFKRLRKFAFELLSNDIANLLMAKIEFNYFKDPIKNTGALLELLKYEFPEKKQLGIASAIVISKAVNRINKYNHSIEYDKANLNRYSQTLGITSHYKDMILIEMLKTAIGFDPKSRQSYELLVKLPRDSREEKNNIEGLLHKMLIVFPDDPFPCLELASVYYEKNAYRKAELILEEAMKRAPHDNRVIDRRTLSLLISAEKNFKRNKNHLVLKDMDKAKKMNSKKVEPFVIEKEIFYKGSKNPVDISSIIDEHTNSLSLFENLKILSIFLLDVKYYRNSTINFKSIEKIFDKYLKKINEVSSSQILKLLSPLESEYLWILPSRNITDVFHKKWKYIFKAVNNSDILMLFDILLSQDLYAVIIEEIGKRKKTADQNQKIILRFYEITIKYIYGTKTNPDHFFELLEDIDIGMEKILKTEARRLSKHASGHLREALERFNFEILMFKLPRLSIFDYFEDDDDDYYDDDDFYDY